MIEADGQIETHTKSKHEEESVSAANATVLGAADGEFPLKTAASACPRYLLRFEYNGTRFKGIQRQTNARTVQGVIEVRKNCSQN
jgi:hypothetical protein